MQINPGPSRPTYILGLILLALVCTAIMTPRLVSPQFGLLDDGVTIQASQQILEGGWTMGFDPGAGRFRPVYWLYYALIYRLAGASPFWFFIGNLLLFIATTVTLVTLVRQWGGSQAQALVTGLLFALAGPVIENTYTLSKGEALQLLLVLLGLVVLSPFAGNPGGRWKPARLIAGTLLFLAAILTKETALTMIPIGIGWLVLAWLGRRGQPLAPFYPAVLAGGAMSAVLWLAGRMLMHIGAVGGGYSGGYSFSLNGILASLVRWGGWLIRDEAYLAPLALLFMIAILSARRDRRRLPQPQLILGALVWMMGWMVVFLPWEFTVEYYMLAFAAGAAVLGGLVLIETWGLFTSAATANKLVWGACVITAALLFATTLSSSATNARIQLAVDSSNAQTMDWLAANLPQNAQVLLNIQAPNEYTTEIGLHLSVLRGRPDLSLRTYSGGEAVAEDVYIITPTIQNQVRLSVRMGVFEPALAQWEQSLQSALQSSAPQTLYENIQRFRMSNVDLPQLLCPFMRGRSYCAIPSPTLDRRMFSYGWRVFLTGTGGATGLLTQEAQP